MNFRQRLELTAADLSLRFFNGFLRLLAWLFFSRLRQPPKKILVYKLGNIGDVVCAMPAFDTIRNNYSEAEIVLLSSPGQRGAPGAAELLKHSPSFDRRRIYYSDEINSFSGIINIWRELRREKFDLFIQLPDDWADFRTLARNMIFAKMIGVRSAFGFILRTSVLFKKTQVDWRPLQKNEVESLLAILSANDVKTDEVDFDFGDTAFEKSAAENLLREGFGRIPAKLIGFNLGAKRPANEWGDSNFLAAADFIQKKGNHLLIFFGGEKDRERNEKTIQSLSWPDRALNAAGRADLLTSRELMKKCLFLVSSDTGTVHLAASAGCPVIAVYSVRSAFGKWFPWGSGHEPLFHRFFDCDYRQESCIAKSSISVKIEEVIGACREFLEK